MKQYIWCMFLLLGGSLQAAAGLIAPAAIYTITFTNESDQDVILQWALSSVPSPTRKYVTKELIYKEPLIIKRGQTYPIELSVGKKMQMISLEKFLGYDMPLNALSGRQGFDAKKSSLHKMHFYPNVNQHFAIRQNTDGTLFFSPA